MAFAKATLQQLFSWCPLNQQANPAAADRQPDIDASAGNRSVKQHRQMVGTAQPTTMPDIRQCEPWRQSALIDATTRNDATRHERLSR